MQLEFSQSSKHFEEVKKAAIQALQNVFPVKGKLRTLTLEKAWVEDSQDITDYRGQEKSRNNESTWGVPVYAHLKLIENGTVVDENPKLKLMTLPKPTQRHSYIVGGNEYQVHNQLRLKPGVYTIRKQNGELKTQVNLSKGKNFDLKFDETKGLFFIQKVAGGQANIALYPIITYLGISKADVAKSWGDSVTNSNMNLSDPKAVEKLRIAFKLRPNQDLKEYLDSTKIDPDTTKAALGMGFDKVDGLMLLAASKKLLNVHLGKDEPTDRDSLEYKELHSIDDFIRERLEKNKNTLSYRIKRSIDSPKRVKINQLVNTSAFNSVINNFFLQDDKSSTPEQTNPLEMLTGTQKVTIMGAGGIGTTHAITPEMRQIHPSHLGIIDPVHTPSSSKIGANLHLTLGTVKDGNQLKTRVIDKKGKEFLLDPVEMKTKKIGFPDERGKDIVKVLYRGQIQEIPKSEVDYYIPSASNMFSYSTNLIPFLPSAQGNRAEMAAKMMEQAIALKHREAPLVQSLHPDKQRTFEDVVGEYASVRAPEDGSVKKITDDTITLSTTKGDATLNLYNNFALNRKSFIHHYPAVKVGDKVTKGQLLADSNYTKGGQLALGTNLKTAYVSYHGLNFDDGVVVSDTASKKLTSEHIYKKDLDIYPNILAGLAVFKSYYPNTLESENISKLDSDGVIRKGETVKPGNILITALQKRMPSQDIVTMSKVLSERPKDVSVTWTLEDTGVVIDVLKSPKKITVVIKTEEAAKIGDKITNRHGGKGVITKIVSDGEMPKTKDGTPTEVLLSPMGIISRINVSQTYESAMGKVAQNKGERIVIDNFDKSDHLKKVKDILKKEGIDDKEELFDGSTGKSLGQVHVGVPHILKLSKQTQANYSVRQGGPGHGYDANLQPLKSGGEEGSKSLDVLTMYSMLSHGARENLREIAAVRSTKNDEFWKALKSGESLPPPQPSFAFNKFTNYLRGAGIDIKKEGTQMTLTPFTDKQVKEISGGEVKKPVFYRGKDFSPIKDGFFDPIKLGGFKGEKWGHLNLVEPVVNPPFENAVKKITGLGKKYDDIMDGTLHVSDQGELNKDGKGVTGGAAIEKLLDQIDVDKQIELLTKKALKSKGSVLDDTNKQLRYLTALKKLDMKPSEAYIRKTLPVLPSVFRPIYPLPDGNITTSDANVLYQNTGVVNAMMKMPVMDLLDESAKTGIRKDLYEHVKAVSGITDMNIKGKQRSGFISEIKGGEGGQPKEGFFISKLLSKKQDYVGRGTVIPEPDLGIDQVGLPEPMAWKLFEPFVIRELRNFGKTPTKALEEIKNKTALAKQALEIVMKDRKVLLNRAPSLHKFSIMALTPQITEGKSIKTPPLINKGFNMDFDGDEQLTATLTFIPKVVISLSETQFMSQIGDDGMTARFREIVGLTDVEGDFYITNLEDFPHGDLLASKEGEKGRIDFYKVPEGIKVLSYDHVTKRVEWKDVFGWSKHYQREIEIVTLMSGRQIVTDDDPRAVFGIAMGELEAKRFTPSEAFRRKVLVPLAVRTENVLQGTITHFKGMPLEHYGSPTAPIYKDLKLTHQLGHFLGSMVSNGWVETTYELLTGRCFIACVNETLGEYFLNTAKEIFDFSGKELRYFRPDGEKNAYGEGKKWGFLHHNAAALVANLINLGARNKHLPPFFLTANKEFRNGLFAGLMDHDGTISVAHAKGKKPQLMASYSTASIRLAQEMQWLAKSLGIRSRITTSKTPAGEPFWYLSFSNMDIKRWGGEGMLNETKLAHLSNPEIENLLESSAKNDPVPIHTDTAEMLSKNLGARRSSSNDQKCMYTMIRKAKALGRISRAVALKILDELPPYVCEGVPHIGEWETIVRNTDVSWDLVEGYEKSGIKEDGYDLTVPGYETFTNVEGVVLSNTVTVSVPISDGANREADKMLPSRNLFQPGSGSLMMVPVQDAQLGLFYLSQTPAGLKVLHDILGPNYPVTKTLDKKATAEILKKVAHDSPKEYGEIVKKLKSAGEKYVYENGVSIGVNDIVDFSKQTKTIIDGAKKLIGSSKNLAETNHEIQTAVDNMLKKKLEGTGNPFYDQIASGAKGSASQLRSIMVSPLFVGDAKGRVIPTPVSKSYAAGLTTGDYWMASYGVRKGMMDTAIQTSLPGAFSKDIMATVIDNVISAADCGTKDGVTLPVTSNDATERYLAGEQYGYGHNTLVTSAVVNDIKKKNGETVKVRSPLKCKAARGTCAHCFGLDEHGKLPEVGENVGAKMGQTISEPLVQLVMNSKHTGGVAGTGAQVGGYQRINQLLTLPSTLSGSAALATTDGKISKITKGLAGGFDVFIDKTKVHVSQGNKVTVTVGQNVKKGDTLSDGPIKPQDLMRLKGVTSSQDYITDELQKTYKEQGVGITRKTFETVVRSLTNTTQVLNNPKNSDYLPGDITSLSSVNHHNDNLIEDIATEEAEGDILAQDYGPYKKGHELTMRDVKTLIASGIKTVKVEHESIEHQPFVKGMTSVPALKQDWMAGLGYRGLAKVLTEGASQGWKTNTESYHPIPGVAYGVDFGKGKEGKY